MSDLTALNTTTTVNDGIFASVMAMLAGVWIVWLIVVVIAIIGMWKVFEKAGKPGWHSIIPFLNMYDLMEIAGYNGIYFLVCFIPFVGALAFAIMTALGIAKKFGQSTGFAILIILFSPIMYCILGFGSKYVYAGAAGAKKGDDWVEGKNA